MKNIDYFTEQTLLSRLDKARQDVSALKAEKFKLDFALECAESLTWEYTCATNMIIFSNEFAEILGINQSDYDYDFSKFVSIYLSDFKEEILQKLADYIAGKTDMYESEIYLPDTEGHPHWLVVRGKFFDREAGIIYGVSVDITRRKKLEIHLKELAYIAPLTGLYRIEYLNDVVADKVPGVRLAYPGLMLLDICNFSNIEQAFDLNIANLVLRQTAARLTELIGDQLLVHLNEDRFLVIFNNIHDLGFLEETARKITDAFKSPLIGIDKGFYLDFNIGIALSEDPVIDDGIFRGLLQDVQFALRSAKENELCGICTITGEIRDNTIELLNMAYGMHSAIEQKEFFLQFQPIIAAGSKQTVGCEALIRWRHPEKGLLNPMLFIPLAEELGLIISIGDFVLEESLRYLQKWLTIKPDFYVAVNVSAIQFLPRNLPARLTELLAKYAIPPANLVIEITESAFVSDLSYLTETLVTLREMGFKISLDDFGTGYSSLSYLKKLPIDNLKIDRAFLAGVLEDEMARALLKSIITLGKNLSLSITVEGVETEEQLALLNEYDCDRFQGYYFSKPLSAEELVSRITEQLHLS